MTDSCLLNKNCVFQNVLSFQFIMFRFCIIIIIVIIVVIIIIIVMLLSMKAVTAEGDSV